MQKTYMPHNLKAEWIWADKLTDSTDAFVLFRKEFTLERFGLDASVWITANCAYKLYINDRLIGYGPNANPNAGVSYLDQHDVYYYLQSGINVIAVEVYFSAESTRKSQRTPGLWCQLESENRTIVYSGKSWDMNWINFNITPRGRASRSDGMLEFIDSELIPQHWTGNNFIVRENWSKPTYSKKVSDYSARLELHPLRPAQVDRKFDLRPLCGGRITAPPPATFFNFSSVHLGGRGTYGASGFVFNPGSGEMRCPVKLYADEATRIFCNGELICCGGEFFARELTLCLAPGWNNIIIYQSTPKHAMGMYIETDGGGEVLEVHPRPDEKSPTAWLTAGPMKMAFEALPGDLDFSRLHSIEFEPRPDNVNDISSCLRSCVPEPDAEIGSGKKPLKTGDYLIFKLDDIRYGFPVIELSATRNDIIDVTIGNMLEGSSMPSPGKFRRGTHTMRCRSGENVFTLFRPRECSFVAISVRRALREVSIKSVRLAELRRPAVSPQSLTTSEEWINTLWETGRMTLSRSGCFVPSEDPKSDYTAFMLDSYIEAVNNACTTGDFSYSSSRLQEFVKGQFEDGSIPAVSGNGNPVPQGAHSFFMPLWINYNYRLNGDLEELVSLAGPLLMLAEFWEKRRNLSDGLLHETPQDFTLRSRISQYSYPPESAPVYLNALYCRFLFSAAETFKLAGMEEKQQHCLELAGEIIDMLGQLKGDAEFLPGCFEDGKAKGDPELLGNFCAMLGGILPLGSFDSFRQKFFRTQPGENPGREEAQPYFHFLFADMMFSLKPGEWGFNYFRRYWEAKKCPDAAAWRLDFGSDEPAPVRLSEGRTVSPNMVILRDIIGVRIFNNSDVCKIYLNPRLDLLDSLDLCMPLPQGKFVFKLQKNPDGTLDITLDANFELHVIPELDGEVLRQTAFELGEPVRLFCRS